MNIYGKVSGSFRTVTQPYAKAGGAWRTCTAVYAKSGGSWRQVWAPAGPALSANLSPGSVSGSGTGNGPLTTDSCTCTPSGGTAPYSYAWTYSSGDGAISADSGSAASTTFSVSGTAQETKTGAWHCHVTDSVAGSTNTGDVSIALTFNLPALSVTLTSHSVSKTVFSFGTPVFCQTNANATVASGSGGQAPYSYLWEYVDGDAGMTVTGSGTVNPRWSDTQTPTQTKFANYRCKVTDNLGSIAYSDNCGVTLDFQDQS